MDPTDVKTDNGQLIPDNSHWPMNDEQKGGVWGEISGRVWGEVPKGLPELEAQVVRMRFGIAGGRPLSVTKVAKALKLTRERVHQIEAKAVNKLEEVSPQSTSGVRRIDEV
jgi:DNA-directed RNA polymerase sigma subunit (sigma70/sigma32)